MEVSTGARGRGCSGPWSRRRGSGPPGSGRPPRSSSAESLDGRVERLTASAAYEDAVDVRSADAEVLGQLLRAGTHAEVFTSLLARTILGAVLTVFLFARRIREADGSVGGFRVMAKAEPAIKAALISGGFVIVAALIPVAITNHWISSSPPSPRPALLLARLADRATATRLIRVRRQRRE